MYAVQSIYFNLFDLFLNNKTSSKLGIFYNENSKDFHRALFNILI